MDFECIENIDQLKIKYEYTIKNIAESDDICSHLGFLCYYGIFLLLEKINQLIENLKLYNGPKKDMAAQYLKEMTELYSNYSNLQEEVSDYNLYYIRLINDIKINYKIKPEIKNIKETSLKAIKAILDSNVETYIKYDKKIINLYNKIKDLNYIFKF